MHHLLAVFWLVPISWVVHDLEEVATLARWRAAHETELQRLASRSRIAEQAFASTPDTTRQFATSVSLVGVVLFGVTAAVTLAPQGISKLVFAVALGGYALHVGTHCLQSLLIQGYSPGVVTAVFVVLPSVSYVYRRLLSAAFFTPITALWTALLGIALFPALAVGAHRVSGRFVSG
ncbi:HXXEE domain-containing protein [Halorhabdus amylolytica]|uniref:HXXEE domain-containing protein n=1 Tax=Halorhabdus amylolytica TaxID=2559573 RepID=UPI00145B4547|nr:HXXEE domain-containing protein [Halorhabdus amylolytica]